MSVCSHDDRASAKRAGSSARSCVENGPAICISSTAIWQRPSWIRASLGATMRLAKDTAGVGEAGVRSAHIACEAF